MKTRVLYTLLICSFAHAMGPDHNSSIELPSFDCIAADVEIRLPGDEENGFKYLTLDTIEDGLFSAAIDADPAIISFTLHTYKPTGNAAFGRASSRKTYELCDSDKPITGFDIFPEWPGKKAFAICRQEGWCTIFDIGKGSSINHRITQEHLRAVYFENSRTAICLSNTLIYRWNFITGTVTQLGTHSQMPPYQEHAITIRTGALEFELSGIAVPEDTVESSDHAEKTEKYPCNLFNLLRRVFT